jgi:hypothetical protein
MSGIMQMSLANALGLVWDGLTVYLDAGTYPGSGTAWTDNAKPENNATLVNAPTFSSATGGYFTFASASTQYATVSGSPINSASYTKSCWFYLNSTTDNNLLSFDDGAATGHYMFFGGTNRLYAGHTAWTGFPTTFQSAGSFSNSVWHSAAVTFNTTDGMKIYINGVLDSTYTAQLTAPVGVGLNIGSYSAGGNLLNGRIAQVLIYNRSLRAEEISRNFAATRSRFGI